MLTLVIGLPGSGKTEWVKAHLRDGIAFDLDHVAAAFRLAGPHEERHRAARTIANELAAGFARNAMAYSSRVFVIRTAPTMTELEEIKPDRLVVCEGSYDISGRADYIPFDTDPAAARIAAAVRWAQRNGVAVEISM